MKRSKTRRQSEPINIYHIKKKNQEKNGKDSEPILEYANGVTFRH